MTEHRWSKFWWQDWQADQALRSCSLAARGLWMDMLCIAHTGTPRGHVTINGSPVTTKRLAILAGTSEKECGKLLAELREAGVFSETPEGAIYSRRMVRDNDAAEAGREAVSRRWRKGDDPTRGPITPPNTPPSGGPSTQEAEAEAEAETTLAGGSRPRGRRVGLPDDWLPKENYDPAVLARFRDWNRAKARLSADWDAAWRLWLADEPQHQRAGPKTSQLPVSDQNAELLRLMARARGEPDAPPPQHLRLAQ